MAMGLDGEGEDGSRSPRSSSSESEGEELLRTRELSSFTTILDRQRGKSRTFSEHTDELHRSGHIRLWPYVMRQHNHRLSPASGSAPSLSAAPPAPTLSLVPALLSVPAPAAPQEQEEEEQQQQQAEEEGLAWEDQLQLLHAELRQADTEKAALLSSIMKRSEQDGRKTPTRLRQSRRPPPRGPMTAAVEQLEEENTTDCTNACGVLLPTSRMAKHLEHECELRVVPCPMPDCGSLMQKAAVRRHLDSACRVALMRRTLAIAGAELTQEGPCAMCGEAVRLRDMHSHITDSCVKRIIMCPVQGCGVLLEAAKLKQHQAEECEVLKRTAELAMIAAKRERFVECSGCHNRVEARTLQRHMQEECPHRKVPCPNAELGCTQHLTACLVGQHLQEECQVTFSRQEMAQRSEARRKQTQCGGCGALVKLERLGVHQRDECPNRRVPCKNWELGCPVLVRIFERDKHERVQRMLQPRPCLSLEGGDATVVVGEGSKKPPWTVEFWLWRPDEVETTRAKIRMGLEDFFCFLDAKDTEMSASEKLQLLEEKLKKGVSKEEAAAKTRDSLMDEMISAASIRDESRVALVRSLFRAQRVLRSALKGIDVVKTRMSGEGFRYGPDKLSLVAQPWYAHFHGKDSSSSSTAGIPGASNEVRNTEIDTPASETKAIEEVDLPPPAGDSAAAADEPKVEGSEPPVVVEVEGQQREQQKVEVHPSPSGGTNDIETDKLAPESAGLNAEEAAASDRWAEWNALQGDALIERVQGLLRDVLPKHERQVEDIVGFSIQGSLLEGGGEEGPGKKRQTLSQNNNGAVDKKKGRFRRSGKKNRKAKRQQQHAKQFGMRLEKRVGQSVHKQGGMGTLASSHDCLLQLELGEEEQVGFCLKGVEEFPFKYRLPRMQWVHLAFVATSKGVTLLENGLPRSSVDVEQLPLPMDMIGSPDGLAAHCLVQEVRYWGCQRSNMEVMDTMHKCLSTQEAVQDGLLAYLTLEEGKGKFVYDVTEQLYRMPLRGGMVKWMSSEPQPTLPEFRAEPPTPSFLEKNVCKVELRRARLAMKSRASNLTVVSCPLCQQEMMKKQLRLHTLYACPMRTVACVLHEAGCADRLPLSQMAQHLRDHCKVRRRHLEMAARGEENRSTASCSLCGEKMRNADLSRHEKHCDFRPVSCKWKGCTMALPMVRIKHHEKYLCQSRGATRHRLRVPKIRGYERPWAWRPQAQEAG